MNRIGNAKGTLRYFPICAMAGAIIVAGGCASNRNSEPGLDKSDAGQILGGVAGAAAGTQVGDGSGRTIAIVAGALLGSAVGERIGARMERDDRRETALVLEDNRTGQSTAWVNPDTGNRFRVTPKSTYERNGQPCRQFEFRVETERGSDLQERTACRNGDGTWEVVG